MLITDKFKFSGITRYTTSTFSLTTYTGSLKDEAILDLGAKKISISRKQAADILKQCR